MAANRIEGIPGLLSNLSGLKTDMETKQADRIVVAGGRVLRYGARSIAQALGLRKTGALIKNIVIKRERNAPAGTVEYHLGERHGRDLGNGKKVKKYLSVNKAGRVVTRRENDPYYWRFLEFTTKRRIGTPFIGASLEQYGDKAIEAMTDAAKKVVDEANK